jgi:hypothetical protein
MKDNAGATADRDALLDTFVAELTRAAYHVALRHGAAGTWLDLQLDLWQALADTVKQWGGWRPTSGSKPRRARAARRRWRRNWRSRTWGRIQALEVEVTDNRVIVRGRADVSTARRKRAGRG